MIFIPVALTLFACATPQTMRPSTSGAAVEAEAQKQKCLLLQEETALRARLFNVHFRVIDGARQMTSRRRDFSGFLVAKRSHFPSDYQNAASEVFRLGTGARIILVAAGSPADLAGLRVGDEVLTINGESVPEDPKKMDEFFKTLGGNSSRILQVVRDGEESTIEVKPVSCAECEIALQNDDKVNASADGQKIYVTKGMMRVVTDDNELAMIISHELAHNLREHMKMTRTNAAVGGFVGLLFDVAAAAGGVNTSGGFMKMGMKAGQLSFSKDMESEADYVGLYILANSGYDIDSGPNVFRRIGVNNPRSMEAKYATTHPATPERFVMLEQTIREIQGKRDANIALIPEEKPKTPTKPAEPVVEEGTTYRP